MSVELDPLEARVLGVLIEKAMTTPDQYPLSLNALIAGCNQKSNRHPVMSVTEPEARLSIDGLRQKHLAGATNPAGGRVERYHHTAAEVLGLHKPGLAILTELLLRGPQSRGELRGRASRMAPIESLDALGELLATLKEKGYVEEHPPAPGSRAPRIAELLSPDSHPAGAASAPASAPSPPPPPSGGGDRVRELELQVAVLQRQLKTLAEKLGETLDE